MPQSFDALSPCRMPTPQSFEACSPGVMSTSQSFEAWSPRNMPTPQSLEAWSPRNMPTPQSFEASSPCNTPTSQTSKATRRSFLPASLFFKTKTTQHNSQTEAIMNQNKSVHRTLVALKLPRGVSALITYALGLVTALTGNAHFATPSPALTDLTTAIGELQTAQANLSRNKGAIAARNDKKEALVKLLQELRGYIQKTADADPENGAAIVQSSGLPARKTVVHKARVFDARPGAISGSVEVLAPVAARRASYEWQFSTDGGKTWIESAPSMRARTTISGLAVASMVQLRYRSVTKAGPSDWSQPVTIVVK